MNEKDISFFLPLWEIFGLFSFPDSSSESELSELELLEVESLSETPLFSAFVTFIIGFSYLKGDIVLGGAVECVIVSAFGNGNIKLSWSEPIIGRLDRDEIPGEDFEGKLEFLIKEIFFQIYCLTILLMMWNLIKVNITKFQSTFCFIFVLYLFYKANIKKKVDWNFVLILKT